MKPRIIVCGLGRTGYQVFCLLQQQGAKVVGINAEPLSDLAISAPIFALAALGNRAIGQLRLFHQTWAIREELMDADHPWLGKRLSEPWADRSRMLTYYLPDNSAMDLVSAVVSGQSLQLGDRLIIAIRPKIQTVRQSLKHHTLGFLAGLRIFHAQVKLTILITLTLLFTIFIAILIYTVNNFQVSIVDALYFSVGMITGAGGAAPSFATAALGGRILGTGLTADILWVALATLITQAHPFWGQRVQSIAMDADWVPLYLERPYLDRSELMTDGRGYESWDKD